MPNSRRPSNKSRFEIPVSSRKAVRDRPEDRRQPYKRYQGRDDTNRALINAALVAVSTVVTTVLLLAISGQIYDTTNARLVAQSAGPLPAGIIATPTLQPTLAPATPSPQPGRALPTPSLAAESPTPAATPDDTAIQAAIDKKLGADDTLAALEITATVNEGKVILVGTAPSDELKAKVERLVRSVRGVKQVDNQIAVVIN